MDTPIIVSEHLVHVGLPFLHLASRSPRRRELLTQIGIEFRVVDVEVDESRLAGESPEAYVQRLATAKARAGAVQVADPHALVLGADTTVVLDGEALGKPADASEAHALLQRLSGRAHRVLSAVALAGADTGVALSESTVWFREIEHSEREAYVASGEPMDKAGGYGIQGRAAVFVSRLDGSYSGIMGLPLYELAQLLRGKRGVTTASGRESAK